ncbi:MAG: hypothetical protein IPH42_05275 [Bacteroidetes bacterium]|nr:hypothetical protein [Bacteroidota bacterium]
MTEIKLKDIFSFIDIVHKDKQKRREEGGERRKERGGRRKERGERKKERGERKKEFKFLAKF